MTFSADGRTRTTSWGANSVASRLLALNGFNRVALDPDAEYEWARTSGTEEVWIAQATVPWTGDLADLWGYLSGPIWEEIGADSEPASDFDALTIELPSETEMVLVQLEPRNIETGSAAGELQRIAIYFHPIRGEFVAQQWLVPAGTHEAIALFRAYLLVDGEDVYTTDDTDESTHVLTLDGFVETIAAADDFFRLALSGSTVTPYEVP